MFAFSLYPQKSVIFKPHNPCVLLYASRELIICLMFLNVNLVTDKKLVLPVFYSRNIISFAYKISIYMFKSMCIFAVGRRGVVLVI